MVTKENAVTYANSGVDISKGNQFAKRIKKIARSTYNKGTMGPIGAFSALFDPKPYNFKDPILVAATDGVGTKLSIANEMNSHKNIGVDLVAMCVNDVLCQGAKPLFFLDYLASGLLDTEKFSTIISGIAEGCQESGCALVGGETAEMPGLYNGKDYDLAGFAVGMVERNCILPHKIREGDSLIGLNSNGLHSNGFSLIRNILSSLNIDIHSKSPFSDNVLGDDLLIPTKIYVNKILKVIEKSLVSGISHITGGGLFDNIERSLPENHVAKIDLSNIKPQGIYEWIKKTSVISENEMLRTFNCGIGLVIIVKSNHEEEIIFELEKLGETPIVLGKVISGSKSVRTGSLF